MEEREEITMNRMEITGIKERKKRRRKDICRVMGMDHGEKREE